jgi:hypothetical protein
MLPLRSATQAVRQFKEDYAGYDPETSDEKVRAYAFATARDKTLAAMHRLRPLSSAWIAAHTITR